MADEELITDFFGAPVGKFRKEADRTEASTFHGEPLGSADNKGTRDFFGRPISNQNVPGLLFSPEHNPMLKEKKEAEERKKRDDEERRARDREEEAERTRREEEVTRTRRKEEDDYFAEQDRRSAEREREHLAYFEKEKSIEDIIKRARKTYGIGLPIKVIYFIKREGRLPYRGELLGWNG